MTSVILVILTKLLELKNKKRMTTKTLVTLRMHQLPEQKMSIMKIKEKLKMTSGTLGILMKLQW